MNRHAPRPSLDGEDDARAALSEICSSAAVWRHMREEASAALTLEPALAPLLVGSVLNRSSFAEAVIRRVSAKLGAPAVPAEMIADAFEAARDFNLALRTFPTVLWAKTFFSSEKPLAEFTASDAAQGAPQVKF